MNVIKYILLIGCILISVVTLGQKGNHTLPRFVYPRDTLDEAKLCVHYRQLVKKDTAKPDDLTSSEMILQIGKHLSNYTNWVQLYSDSITYDEITGTDEDMMKISNRAVARTRNSGDYQTIFKNYPVGKYLTQTRVFFDQYLIEEDTPVFNWKLQPGESEWLGYKCRKATCSFRGRNYTAWYAPAIPINNGPWKFNGLPGLILRVADSRGDYTFDAILLYKVNWKRPIYLLKKPQEFKTPREKFLRAEKNGFANVGALIQRSGKVLNAPPVTKKFPYNPIELE